MWSALFRPSMQLRGRLARPPRLGHIHAMRGSSAFRYWASSADIHVALWTCSRSHRSRVLPESLVRHYIPSVQQAAGHFTLTACRAEQLQMLL